MMKYSKRNHLGFANLLAIIFLSFIATLVISVVSLKILVGIERTQSLSDTLVSTYTAETEINDVIARFLGSYPSVNLSTYHNKLLSDGKTYLTVTSSDQNGITTVDVLAKRPFSSTKLELTKQTNAISNNVKTDIVLTLDCTGSMVGCANPDNHNNCGASSAPTNTTRFEELQKGSINFIKAIQNMNNPNVRVGVNVFTLDANWATTMNGVPMTPENNASGLVSLSDILTALQNKFQKNPLNSAICDVIHKRGSTPIAEGLAFTNTYFKDTAGLNKKQIQVLVTDGEPNSVVPDAACNEQYLVPDSSDKTTWACPNLTPMGDPSASWPCKQVHWSDRYGTYNYAFGASNPAINADLHSQWELACELADNHTHVDGFKYGQSSVNGQRDVAADSYIVTIFKVTNSNVLNIFNTYSSGYYDMKSATDLSNTLTSKILPQIQSSINKFQIRKVNP